MKNFTPEEAQWLKENIENSDIISFDIFDTLIERSFYFEPSELFEAVYKNLFDNQHSGKVYRKLRIQAEELARTKAWNSGFQEVTLDEIYKQLAILSDFSQQDINNLKKEEEALEIQACYTKQKGKDLYELAKLKEKKIWIVSDIYLNRNVIEQILSKNGFDNYENLIISSEIKLTKHSGDLFRKIKTNCGNEKIFHIGDNIISDYNHPKFHGIEASHILSRRDEFHQIEKPNTVLFDEQSKAINPLFFLHGSPYHINGLKDKNKFEQYFFSIGYSLMCPLIIGFINALNNKKEFKSNKQLICLARDGQIVHKVAQRLNKIGTSRFDSKYVYASRRVTSLPFVEQDPHTIGLYFHDTYKNSKSLDDFLEKMYITDESLKTKAKKIFSKIRKDKHYFRAMAKFYKLWQPSLINEQHNYVEYLSEKISLESSVVFDAGWSGSLLKGISKVFPNLNMSGYFFGVEPYSPMVNQNLYGYYLDYDKPYFRKQIILQNKALIECLFMADHASVQKIEKIGQKFVPKFAKEGIVGEKNIVISKLISSGVEACLNDIENNLPIKESLSYLKSIEAKELLDHFITNPLKDDLRIFGDVQLLSGIGDTKGVPLIHKKKRHIFDKKRKGVKAVNSHWQSGVIQVLKKQALKK